MWIASKYGFFSIVKKEALPETKFYPAQPGGWHVRARVKGDLRALLDAMDRKWGKETVDEWLDKTGNRAGGVLFEWPEADYQFRVVFREEHGNGPILGLMVVLGEAVDYDNFKDEIGKIDSQKEKVPFYHEIWATLLRLQPRSIFRGLVPERFQARVPRPYGYFSNPPIQNELTAREIFGPRKKKKKRGK